MNCWLFYCLLALAGKTFPAFPAHAQPAILRIWQEAHIMATYAMARGPYHRYLCSKFSVIFHWYLFRIVQLTMCQHRSRLWMALYWRHAITWTNDDPAHWCLYALSGPSVLNSVDGLSNHDLCSHLHSNLFKLRNPEFGLVNLPSRIKVNQFWKHCDDNKLTKTETCNMSYVQKHWGVLNWPHYFDAMLPICSVYQTTVQLESSGHRSSTFSTLVEI